MEKLPIIVVGGGIFGLWQAFELARRGHMVTLFEAMPEASSGAASRFAGAMLAPYCESEAAEPVVRELGVKGLALWRAACRNVVSRGSLVVASARDQSELTRFQRMTEGHRSVDGIEIAQLEPDLAGRFARGLFFEEEGHIAPRVAIADLITELRRLGADLRFGEPVTEPVWRRAPAGEVVIDCRGMGARSSLADVRGVRGEMTVLRAPEVTLSRPIRLLHPRFPLYVVPWGDDLYMVGATVIEREDAGPVTVRSALDLLGTAYAVHPAFGEAEIIELNAGVRPSLPDNVPKIVVRGRHIYVTGAYRHGYLLAPVLAGLTADFIETGSIDARVFVIDEPNA
ncbi:MAG: FAD-dependent oxidoreductase [Sphingomonadales bacterium]|nr:FAD-dependent oxidoreductase [Sphingomonadales bacterium]